MHFQYQSLILLVLNLYLRVNNVNAIPLPAALASPEDSSSNPFAAIQEASSQLPDELQTTGATCDEDPLTCAERQGLKHGLRGDFMLSGSGSFNRRRDLAADLAAAFSAEDANSKENSATLPQAGPVPVGSCMTDPSSCKKNGPPPKHAESSAFMLPWKRAPLADAEPQDPHGVAFNLAEANAKVAAATAQGGCPAGQTAMGGQCVAVNLHHNTFKSFLIPSRYFETRSARDPHGAQAT